MVSPMVRQLIDKRLRNAIPDFWPSLCTIQSKVYAFSGSNQLAPVAYNDIYVDIPCRLAPRFIGRVEYDEKRSDRMTTDYNQRELMLNAYLPDIQVRDQVATVDGVTYQIRGIDNDGQKFLTRLRVEIVDGGTIPLGSVVRSLNLSSQLPGSVLVLPYLPVGKFFQLFRGGYLQSSNGYSVSGLNVTLTIPGMVGEIIQVFYYS